MIKIAIRLLVAFVLYHFSAPLLNHLFFDTPDLSFTHLIYIPIFFALTKLNDGIDGFAEGIFTGVKALIPGIVLLYFVPQFFFLYLIIFFLLAWRQKHVSKYPKTNDVYEGYKARRFDARLTEEKDSLTDDLLEQNNYENAGDDDD